MRTARVCVRGYYIALCSTSVSSAGTITLQRQREKEKQRARKIKFHKRTEKFVSKREESFASFRFSNGEESRTRNDTRPEAERNIPSRFPHEYLGRLIEAWARVYVAPLAVGATMLIHRYITQRKAVICAFNYRNGLRKSCPDETHGAHDIIRASISEETRRRKISRARSASP